MIERGRRFSREEYDRLVGEGMFARQKLELFRGGLRPMSPIGVPHSVVVTRLYRLLDRAVPAELEVHCQQPLACADESEPEPDVSIVPFVADPTCHPSRAALVVEIADSSLGYDLGDKAALYAESDVLEYWVVDVNGRRIIVHRDPVAGSYRSIVAHAEGESVAPLAAPDHSTPVKDVL